MILDLPMRLPGKAFAVPALLALAGCMEPEPYDYTAFKQSKPRSILVLPPVNDSPEVAAGSAVMASSLRPLAEAGYYVFPPTVTTELFKENGLTEPAEIHAVSLDKIREVFQADAVLYISITEYGQQYYILGSSTTVAMTALLVDGRSGVEIWRGAANVVDDSQPSSGAGIVGILVQAAVEQIAGQLLDKSYELSKYAAHHLLSPDYAHLNPNPLLIGPRRVDATTNP